jgi:hypothetical protein
VVSKQPEELMALKVGWWTPSSVDEATAHGAAEDRAIVHRRKKTEPLRRRVLADLAVAEKRLRNALVLLARFDALERADPETVEFERRILAAPHQAESHVHVAAFSRNMRRRMREDRKQHPEYWDGKRPRMPWERRVVDVLKSVTAVRDSIAAEQVSFPRYRPASAKREQVLRILHAQMRTDEDIVQALMAYGLEKGTRAQVTKRVRSALNEFDKRRVRRTEK